MDAIFNAVDMSAIASDSFSFVMVVLTISLIMYAVYLIAGLIFPASTRGGNGDHD
jgi:hypothetical protein